MQGEVRSVEFEFETRRAGTGEDHTVVMQFHIPAVYQLVVCQLAAEIELGNHTDMYESRRRQTYARKVLDLFGQEIRGFVGYSKKAMATFRSRVLTPIVMRMLWGVSDAYTPFVTKGVQRSHKELTIEAATEFYLAEDPTDPSLIPTYRRNILYIPMARWYLGRILHPLRPLTTKDYKRVLGNHDKIMAELKQTTLQGADEDEDGIPMLTESEASAIADEEITRFFRKDLARLVSCTCLYCALPLSY